MTEEVMTTANTDVAKFSETLDWDKVGGLMPAVIQDAENMRILMVGFMNRGALAKTFETGKVTFFSRTRQAQWTKGETTGHFLKFISAETDCDRDTLLIQARPDGPTCHRMTQTCFNDDAAKGIFFLETLGGIIAGRNKARPEGSYTTKLFTEGRQRIAQKVGEEGVELALAAAANDKDNMKNEAADLVFHLMVLLEDAGLSLDDVCGVLKERHGK